MLIKKNKKKKSGAERGPTPREKRQHVKQNNVKYKLITKLNIIHRCETRVVLLPLQVKGNATMVGDWEKCTKINRIEPDTKERCSIVRRRVSLLAVVNLLRIDELIVNVWVYIGLFTGRVVHDSNAVRIRLIVVQVRIETCRRSDTDIYKFLIILSLRTIRDTNVLILQTDSLRRILISVVSLRYVRNVRDRMIGLAAARLRIEFRFGQHHLGVMRTIWH